MELTEIILQNKYCFQKYGKRVTLEFVHPFFGAYFLKHGVYVNKRKSTQINSQKIKREAC